MNRLFQLSLLVLLMFCGQHFTAQNVLGKWYGIADLNGVKLRINLNLDTVNDRMFATLDSPDQSAYDIPCDAATLIDDSLYISSQVIGLVYTAQLVDSQFVGRLTQVGVNVPLLFQREFIAKEKSRRPQEPNEPYPYAVSEVKFLNKDAGHQLAGTLTLPNTSGKSPLAILISGSGAQNRDEEILDHKPFLVIADYLTRQGIAVLRYDDRGTAESGGSFKGATSEDFASDVQAAIDWAMTHPKIDFNKIGLIGHSEGGMIAPMIASQDELVSFIVLLAAPGTTGREIILDQTRLMMESAGSSQTEVAEAQNTYREIFAVMENQPDSADSKIRKIVTASMDQLSEEEIAQYGGRQKIIDGQVSQFTDPWYKYFILYDPAPALRKTRCPVLAMNGLLDVQVPCSKNLSAIEYALKGAGNKNFEIHAYPELNHMFQHCPTGAVHEYGLIEETFSQEVLNKMAGWINRMTNY